MQNEPELEPGWGPVSVVSCQLLVAKIACLRRRGRESQDVSCVLSGACFGRVVRITGACGLHRPFASGSLGTRNGAYGDSSG